jgi:nucleotide-binding universal stress UspA family protein
MKKIIVPIDFSDTSKNAFAYAAAMASDIPDCELVLYHVYDNMVSGSDGSLMVDDNDARRTITMAALENVASVERYSRGIPVRCVAETGRLGENLEKLFRHEAASMVVMGINGSTRLEQIFFGSSTLNIIRHYGFPVLIIPPEAKFRKIKTILFISDFKKVDATTPAAGLRKILELFNPELHVLHIADDPRDKEDVEYARQKAKLELILTGYDVEYAFIHEKRFDKGISHYADEHRADMIVTIPRHHGFLSGIFKTSHTEKLAFHTHIPVLALHE